MTRTAPVPDESSRQRYVFFLAGKIPSKKSGKVSFRPGRVTINPEYKDFINTITFRAREYWRTRPPLTDVEIDFVFHVRHKAADLDGAVTTVLDCLKDARVIVNDSMAHVRHEGSDFVLISPDQEDGVHIVMTGRPGKPTTRTRAGPPVSKPRV